MIGLDTNVLVRYITQDDANQSAKATALIESLTLKKPGHVSLVSVIELVWVLTSCYSVTKAEICVVLETLLRTKELIVAQAEVVWKAVQLLKKNNADFADCIIECLNADAGCRYTATFDKESAKRCGMRLIEGKNDG